MKEYLDAMERNALRNEYLCLDYSPAAKAEIKAEEVLSEADMLRYEYLGIYESSDIEESVCVSIVA